MTKRKAAGPNAVRSMWTTLGRTWRQPGDNSWITWGRPVGRVFHKDKTTSYPVDNLGKPRGKLGDRGPRIWGRPVCTPGFSPGPRVVHSLRPQPRWMKKQHLTCGNNGFPQYPQPLIRRPLVSLTRKPKSHKRGSEGAQVRDSEDFNPSHRADAAGHT